MERNADAWSTINTDTWYGQRNLSRHRSNRYWSKSNRRWEQGWYTGNIKIWPTTELKNQTRKWTTRTSQWRCSTSNWIGIIWFSGTIHNNHQWEEGNYSTREDTDHASTEPKMGPKNFSMLRDMEADQIDTTSGHINQKKLIIPCM